MNPLSDALWWHFSVSGFETWVWLPPRVAMPSPRRTRVGVQTPSRMGWVW